MKTNIERTVLVEDVDVEIRVGEDENGIIQMIDLVMFCPDCDEVHVLKRFMPIDDEDLQDMLNEDEDYYDDEDDLRCDCPVCEAERNKW